MVFSLTHWSCGLPAASGGNTFLNGGCSGRLVGKRISAGLDRMAIVSPDPSPSVITLKPAIRYQFKTGQRDWPET
jgi:hypothetical protein